ncbi:MAG: multiple sugar transport system substrate-binding protein [Candidatus Eremiobacteraeota bacterium]|nr:multiple sugar transport system substrate-binding protein [Candidatus Eremiobacteraeota bacterium]
MADESDVPKDGLSRRELLRRAGVGAAAVGVAGSGASKAFAFAGPHKHTGRWLSGDLSILQWVHFVPDYDTWFDKTWCVEWGQKNDVHVTVDHIANTQLDARAASEVAAQSGHDIFQFLAPPAIYEDQVINHAPIVQEVQKKVGKMNTLAKLSTYNPRTKKYFALSDNYVPDPVVWRHDLWYGLGEAPTTWENVRKAAPKLKNIGHPIGIGMSNELDSNMANIAFMMCFGAFIQNSSNRLTIKSKQTIEALKFMADIYKNGETDEIFGWNPASNNNFLYSGKGSMILNAISATRTPEDQKLPFADDLWIWPIPKGPHGRFGLEHVMGCYVIWKFAKNKPAAQKFLADLCINYKQATTASKLYNFPSFPGAYPFKSIYKAAKVDTHRPHGKYNVLTKIAESYTHNVGYPGFSNAAINEIFTTYLIPQMFAQVAQGKMSAADAASSAQQAMAPIFQKWRDKKKI